MISTASDDKCCHGTEGCPEFGSHGTCYKPVKELPITVTLISGTKHDDQKVDLTYITPEWISLHCQVRMFGTKKYSRNNWMLGFMILRSLASALRHIFLFMWGEDYDPESGLCHLGHASNCLEHAYHDFLYRKQNDDRTKTTADLSKVFIRVDGTDSSKK